MSCGLPRLLCGSEELAHVARFSHRVANGLELGRNPPEEGYRHSHEQALGKAPAGGRQRRVCWSSGKSFSKAASQSAQGRALMGRDRTLGRSEPGAGATPVLPLSEENPTPALKHSILDDLLNRPGNGA